MMADGLILTTKITDADEVTVVFYNVTSGALTRENGGVGIIVYSI
jgi:hypothetical protein